MTGYIVLKQGFDDHGSGPQLEIWTQVGPPVESISAEAAIRKAVDGDNGGTYVAVPIRSFSPQTVKVETKRTVRFA